MSWNFFNILYLLDYLLYVFFRQEDLAVFILENKLYLLARDGAGAVCVSV